MIKLLIIFIIISVNIHVILIEFITSLCAHCTSNFTFISTVGGISHSPLVPRTTSNFSPFFDDGGKGTPVKQYLIWPKFFACSQNMNPGKCTSMLEDVCAVVLLFYQFDSFTSVFVRLLPTWTTFTLMLCRVAPKYMFKAASEHCLNNRNTLRLATRNVCTKKKQLLLCCSTEVFFSLNTRMLTVRLYAELLLFRQRTLFLMFITDSSRSCHAFTT